MRKYTRLVLFIVAALLLFCSCGSGGSDSESTDSSSDSVYDSSEKQEENVSDTNYAFMTNGETDYVIVIPDNATENEKYAAEELNFFLKKSTGVNVRIVSESVAPDGKFLSVGQTKSLKNTNIQTETKELGSSGYIVKTVKDNVFMSGAEDLGTIYSVYKFLEEQIGYKYYSYDCIAYDLVKSAKLKKFDVTDIPSFEQRFVTTRSVKDHRDRLLRLKFQDPYLDDISFLMHSAQYIISYDVYGTAHPEWFATKDALCYSAGETLEDEVVKYYQKVLTDTPTQSGKTILFFGQSDSDGYCTCSKCSEATQKYGSITATMIKFLNNVSDKLQPWIDENQKGRDVKLMFFAYKWSQNPPVQYNANTKTYTYSQDVVMRDNVGVLVAPIFMNYNYAMNSEENESEKQCIEGWAKLTKNLSYYGYYINFTYPMYLFNNFDKQVADYKYFKELGVSYVMEQDMTWIDGYQTFSDYKTFMTSNLMWNSELNPRELTLDFFDNYYREASPYLLKYFDEWKNQYQILIEKYQMKGTCYEKMNVPEYWPMSLLEKWLGYMDEAMSAIDRYRYIDTDLYDTLYKHVLLEKTCLQYRMIELYGSSYYKVDELVSVKKEVLSVMGTYSMVTNETSSAYSNLLALADKWGIKI